MGQYVVRFMVRTGVRSCGLASLAEVNHHAEADNLADAIAMGRAEAQRLYPDKAAILVGHDPDWARILCPIRRVHSHRDCPMTHVDTAR